MTIIEKAIRKRDYIISREGDLDGYRLSDEYLDKLVEEETLSRAVEEILGIGIGLTANECAS